MYRGKSNGLQNTKTNRNIFLAILLITIFGWFLMDNIYNNTEVKFTEEDINLFSSFRRHGVVSPDKYVASNDNDDIVKNLKVEKEIRDIRDKIRTLPNNKPQSKKNMVQNVNVAKRVTCDENQVECNFKEILHNSPVVLLVHSLQDESTYIQEKLHETFEIYPQMLVVDMDKTLQGKNLFSYMKSKNKIEDSKLPLLFINGQLFSPSLLPEDLKDNAKHLGLLKKLQELGKDNIIIKKKIIPSNI